MHAILNIATMAAREAATLLNRYSSQIERVSTRDKGANQIVSEVDLIVEEAIIAVIKQHYPMHKILAEESSSASNSSVSNTGATDSKSKHKSDNDGYEWIIDPLDGTINYLHGFPYYCISIAVRNEGALEHAVILDPVTQDMFTASKGSGAHLNNQRIRVSKTRRISDALISTGMPFQDPEDIKPWMRSYAAMLPRAQSIVRGGSSALDLAYVACGRYDALWQVGLKPWDMAAGILLIQEAGGILTDASGKHNSFENGQIICGNNNLHEKVLQLVGRYLNA